MRFDRSGTRTITRGGARLLGWALALGVLAATPALAAGELRIANSGEPDTLDPHHVSGVWENRIIGDMFMGLTTEAADGSVIPGAAESWQVSDDGTVYTFTLRDHTWSDGTPVTRRRLRVRAAAHPRPGGGGRVRLAALHDQERQGAQRGRDRRAWTSSASRALDPKTLEITLESADALLHRAADPLHRLPDAQAQGRGARRRLDQARQHRRQRRLHGGRVAAQQPHQARQERRRSTTPTTSRSTA